MKNRLLKALEKEFRREPASIEKFVKRQQFPLVEGSTVTFVYQGEADAVHLQHWIYGLPSAQPFSRIKKTDLWYLDFDLPEKSRVEYKFEVVRNGTGSWILDPLNRRRAHDPFGANSVCYGQGYLRPDWTLPDKEARKGRLERLTLNSRVFGERRHLRVYLPARFRPLRRYPLLIVHDGEDFLKYAQLQTVLDNLIHRLEIPPSIVALSQAHDRLREYGADRRHAEFLAQELLPELESRYPIRRSPAARCLMGASFGAVAAFHAAHTFPDVFGRLFLQSGSFVFSEIGTHSRGREFDAVARFVNHYRERPVAVSERVFLTCGTYEPLIYENRSFIPSLQLSGMAIRYEESRDGHNWQNWRDRCRAGLSWLLPGPLWMVYE